MSIDTKWLKQQQPRLIETLLQWSSINSWSDSPAGLADQAQAMTPTLERLNAPIELIDLPSAQQLNDEGALIERPLGQLIKLEKRPEAKKRILLVGHYDTVFSPTHPFQTPQKIDETHINGPGVSDMKGGLLIMLTALEAFEKLDVAHNIGWTIAINPDEEIGSPASCPLLEKMAPSHTVGLDFEPSMDATGTLAGSRGGSANYNILIKGQAAHAGRAFDKGRNALAHASKLIQALHALNGKYDDLSVNIAKCDGGGPLNMVPDTAIIKFNVRIHEEDNLDSRLASIQKLVERFHTPPDFDVSLHTLSIRPPKPCIDQTLKLFEQFKQVAATLGQSLSWQNTGGVCDGNNLAAAGLPNIDTLGAIGGGIHTDKEWIDTQSLYDRTLLTATWLAQFAASSEDIW